MHEVVEAEDDESYESEVAEDVANLDVHHRSGTGVLTAMATHTSMSLEPKMCWVKMMLCMNVGDEVILDALGVLSRRCSR